MVKRFLSMLCALSIMLAALPSALAEEYCAEDCLTEMDFGEEYVDLHGGPTGGLSLEIECKVMESYENDGSEISLFSQGGSATEEDIYLYLVEAIENRDLSDFSGDGATHYGIDVRSLNIPIENASILFEAIRRTFFFHPELLIYNRWTPWVNGSIFTYVEVIYMFEGEEGEAQKKAIRDAIDEYKEIAKDVPDVAGKMLVIHDELAKRCRYATQELEEIKANGIQNITQNKIYTGYGALVENVAVCQGYAIALCAIYSEIGIENVLCRNDDPAVNHIWNVVRIDGEWYHIDATWDDSDTKDLEGNLMEGNYYNWFLVTDAKNAATGHGDTSNWEISGAQKDVPCTSTKYESGHIFSGEYVYDGLNYGGWYGNITYEENRYKIKIFFYPHYSDNQGEVVRFIVDASYFYSKNIKSNGMIASEPHKPIAIGMQDTTTVITYFSNTDLGSVDFIAAEYEDGIYKGRNGGNLFKSVVASSAIQVRFPKCERKIMLWKTGTQEPVCEARMSE